MDSKIPKELAGGPKPYNLSRQEQIFELCCYYSITEIREIIQT
jgi:hypothetical protein